MQTCDAEIVQPEIDVSQQAVVLIDNTIDASIETVSPIVQVNAEEYVLSSGGMYGGSAMVGAVPKWILDAVQQQLTTGDGNLATVVSDIQALLGTLQTGVSQVVQSLNTLSLSTSSITTALKSEVDQNHSEVMNIVATKVDATQAQTLAVDMISSTFGGNVDSYIANIASTYTDANSAIAQEINLLAASYNDTTVKIEDLREVSVGTFSEWDGVSTPQLGQFTKDGNGTWYQYLGDIEGWVITNMAHSLASTSSVNAELETFASVVAGNLSDLQSQLDGEITSWFYSYAPSQTNEPWATWIASDAASGTTASQDQHAGDLFYDLTNEVAYRFSKSAGVFGWGVISDDIIIKALVDASRAQDTADAKRRVFVNQPIPPYDIGDLWAGGPSGDVKKCKVAKAAGAIYAVSDWELASKYTDDTAALRTVRMFTSVNASIPIAEGVGDLWSVSDRWYTNATGTTESSSQTANGLVLRRWSGSAWVTIARETKNTYASVAWAATASSIIRDPISDAITGWSYADGSGTESQFGIHADNFYIKNSTYGNRPFSIVGSDILFNGKVSFNSVTGSLTSTQQASINTTNVTNGAGWTNDAVANSKPNVYYQSTAPSSTGRILGDLWFDSDDKNQPYRWNGTTWQSVRDLSITDVSNAASAANTAALNALTVAQAAQATADNAIRTYYQSAAPTGLNSTTDVGDMWFDTDDGQAYRWNGTTWVIIEDNSIAVALAAAQSAQTTADGKITSYYQAGQPALADTGDLWYDTDDKNKVYYYNGTSWITLRDGTIADAQTAANNAQSTANTASTNATNALNQLTDIASDNILSPVEKPTVIADYAVIISEQSGIDNQATNYGITTEKTAYDTAVTALTTYLGTLTAPVAWNNTSGSTTIVGTTFRSKFQDVYTTRQTLLNKIYAKAKTIADAAALTAQWSSVSNRPTSLATLNAADGTSLANATTAISDMASDNILSALEKSSVRSEWNTIVLEKAGIESQATIYGITTEKTNYISTITTLGTYLNAGTAWTFSTTVIPSWINDANLSTNTTIVGATFRTNFNNYYVARQALVNKINDSIKALADTAQSTANSKLSSTADLAALINANTTTIDGGKITTGTITANHISAAGLDAGTIKAGVMYNTGGTATTYTMKIDLDNGLIHIK